MKINAIKDKYLYPLDVCPRTDAFCFKEDQNWNKSSIQQLIIKQIYTLKLQTHN